MPGSTTLAGSSRAPAIAARGARGVPEVAPPLLQAAGAAHRRRCCRTADRTPRPTEPENEHGDPLWEPFLSTRGCCGRFRSESAPWSRPDAVRAPAVLFVGFRQIEPLLEAWSGLLCPVPFCPVYFCNHPVIAVGQIVDGMTSMVFSPFSDSIKRVTDCALLLIDQGVEGARTRNFCAEELERKFLFQKLLGFENLLLPRAGFPKQRDVPPALFHFEA